MIQPKLPVALLILTAAGTAQDTTFIGARIIDGTGKAIEKATLLVRSGRIEALGAAVKIPAGAGIAYCMPGYKLHGKPILYFAGFKEHYSLFAASGTFLAALEDELRGYELRKGTVQFP